jgi:hypothetical protein
MACAKRDLASQDAAPDGVEVVGTVAATDREGRVDVKQVCGSEECGPSVGRGAVAEELELVVVWGRTAVWQHALSPSGITRVEASLHDCTVCMRVFKTSKGVTGSNQDCKKSMNIPYRASKFQCDNITH